MVVKAYSSSPPGKQSGITLALALICLIGVTVISLASLRLGVIELLMAGNAESRMNAFQQAQNGLDAVTASATNNFRLTGNRGFTNCTPGHSGGGTVCDQQTLVVPAGYDLTNTQLEVKRLDDGSGAPPRWAETGAQADYSFYGFEVRSTYDGTASRGGRSVQVQSYVVPLPDLSPEDRL